MSPILLNKTDQDTITTQMAKLHKPAGITSTAYWKQFMTYLNQPDHGWAIPGTELLGAEQNRYREHPNIRQYGLSFTTACSHSLTPFSLLSQVCLDVL